MHIVYIITKLELGGAQKVCLALHAGMKTNNISSTLITGSEGVLVSQVENDSTTIFLPSLKREISLVGIWTELKAFFELVRILKTLKNKHDQPIIVHTHSTKAGITGRWAAFFARIPIRIHTVHGFAFHENQPWLVWLLIVACEWVTTFITSHFVIVSSKDQETGNRLLPWFKSKNTIIRAAAFTTPQKLIVRSAQNFSEENPFIIGSISCLKPQKNLGDLLEIFSKTAKQCPFLKLEIIGDGQEREKLEKLAEQLNISHKIEFLGWQSNIAPWLERWDIFTLSSLWEGLPCSVVEARLFKLPVVTYNTGGIGDVVFNNINGFLIPQHNKAKFIAALSLYYHDQKMYLQHALYNDHLTDFSQTDMVKQHIKLYQKLSR